jgi:histidyl-tRNA synthetase
MSRPIYRAPKGTEDLTGRSLARHERLEAVARRLFPLYGYSEIRPPLFEEKGLFVHGSGETSEVVEKQMFVIRREDSEYALRPEGTPSVVRAYLENDLHKTAPFQKLFYVGPMFRYERPQKARLRQFHQVGVEALGNGDPLLDAEAIALGARFFAELGLEGVRTKLNSLGCSNCRPPWRAALLAFQREYEAELCEACRARMERNPLRFLDCKAPGCKALRDAAPRIVLCGECSEHFATTRRLLEARSVSYDLDATLVRGLDYYTRTLFEYVHSGLGARDAVGGGGRYDGLVEQLGGPSTPGIGFALGVEATLIALEALGRDAAREPARPDLFIVAAEGVDRQTMFSLVERCRDAGVATQFGAFGSSVRSQMRAADGSGARRVVVLGGQEVETGRCRLRDMTTRAEREVTLETLPGEARSQVDLGVAP